MEKEEAVEEDEGEAKGTERGIEEEGGAEEEAEKRWGQSGGSGGSRQHLERRRTRRWRPGPNVCALSACGRLRVRSTKNAGHVEETHEEEGQDQMRKKSWMPHSMLEHVDAPSVMNAPQ
eukprot:6749453-Pyramimonas_sp.AAC.1